MERKADLQPPRPDQGRELRRIAEGEGSAPPHKIEHFLRHARAALQRPQPSGTSVTSLSRARRVLVAPTSSSKADSSNPCPDTSIESDAGIRMVRDSRSDVTDLVMSEKLLGNIPPRAGQANPAPMMQQEKFESKKRKGDSDVSANDTSFNSAGNMKLFNGKDGNMGAIGCKREFLHIREPMVNTHKSVSGQSISMNNYPNVSNEFKVFSSDGVLVGDACEKSSQANQPCKSMLADVLEKVAPSSSSGMNLQGAHLIKESMRSIQCIDSHAAASEKLQPVLSNNSMMHTSKDIFDPMDTMSSTCRSSSSWGDKKVTTDSGIGNLSSYFGSLAFTDNGSITNNQVEQSALDKQVVKYQDYLHVDVIRSDAGSEEVCMGGAGSLEMKNPGTSDQKFMGVIGKEIINPPTLASAVATATSLQCTAAAPLNSTTYNPSFYKDASLKCSDREPMGESDLNGKALSKQSKAFDNQSDSNMLSASLLQHAPTSGSATSIRMPLTSVSQTSGGVHDQGLVQKQQQFKQEIVQTTGDRVDSVKCLKGNHGPDRGNEVPAAGNAVLKSDSKPPPSESESRSSSSNINMEPSSVGNPGKAVSGKEAAVSRKKHYDPDVFFKVNGKLYQKLGRIGTGGSSEVYKVISSDCTIYALKKIKLKGRDYSTAYGFCQEIEYLNRLRGKNNIIQLIDFEVTDKWLLEAANNKAVTMKDGRINDDTHIYVVLEYGEIDLAHMLSQKWKEMESSNTEIDQNWLRFYWQQILEAANTIHEERIVHSDLKPANFLLVKGSLKLIDFGIAKAIQSDTTNIQRDSQVGTLNYMSPEAFLCNDQDSDGNTIKCGRPSDIWSLGCILYQMVYGKTPFAEYKTFWAKFKVITDRNHVINYGPVSNPWLVDLMKKCLAWDRNKRWRIPQLLQHPFLAPPMPSEVPSTLEGQCKFLTQIAEHHSVAPQVSLLCSQLKELIIRLSKGE